MIIKQTETDSYKGKMYEIEVYIQDDFVVVQASERYYRFVGECSCVPLCDLIDKEDGEYLKQVLPNLKEPVEVITRITNHVDGFVNVYMRLENSDRTVEGRRIWKIVMHNIRQMERQYNHINDNIEKYRFLLGMSNNYFFDYHVDTDEINVYKYVGEKPVTLYRTTLEHFVEMYPGEPEIREKQQEEMRLFCSYLRKKTDSFEMDFTMIKKGERGFCHVKGGVLYRNFHMVTGMFIPEKSSVEEAYYLTPAARDSGSGLLNKKAAMEYAVEKLEAQDDHLRWFIMMDIDDFKNINDHYGHMFGDEVIRKVAEILQQSVGHRGIIGRFGGDEYFMMLDKVESREDLKILLKTIVKQFYIAYDPTLNITASIGVSQYPADGRTYEKLLEKADKALYIAKDKGKNRHIIYEEEKHGSYVLKSQRVQTVTFALSKEKRREALSDLLSNLYARGITYITEQPEVMKRLRNIFDLDGMTIFVNEGLDFLCSSGKYVKKLPEKMSQVLETEYIQLFGEEGIWICSDMSKTRILCPVAYEFAQRHEIGATIQCLARKNGVPHALVSFDVFNNKRKWSDTDIEMLSIIGGCIVKML